MIKFKKDELTEAKYVKKVMEDNFYEYISKCMQDIDDNDLTDYQRNKMMKSAVHQITNMRNRAQPLRKIVLPWEM